MRLSGGGTSNQCGEFRMVTKGAPVSAVFTHTGISIRTAFANPSADIFRGDRPVFLFISPNNGIIVHVGETKTPMRVIPSLIKVLR